MFYIMAMTSILIITLLLNGGVSFHVKNVTLICKQLCLFAKRGTYLDLKVCLTHYPSHMGFY